MTIELCGSRLAGVAVAAATFLAATGNAQVSFTDQGFETGTDAASFGRGAAMVDIDGDGLLDLVAANDSMPNFFYRQLPDHTFDDAAAAWGIAFDERSTIGLLVADFDNDGDNDIYFISSAIAGQPNQLLRNDISTGGGLTDVTATSGDAALEARNFGGTAIDFDRDGLLDIFLTNPNDGPCFLLRNEGNLVFSDVSTQAGLVKAGAFRHCSAGDFNNDGWIDVAVGAFVGSNVLYRNNGDGTFTDVAFTAGVQSPGENFGMVLEDFDNNGWMDLFLPKYRLQSPSTGPTEVYRNNGDGTFTDVTDAVGMTAQTDMGHNTGDVNGDGYPDIFIGTGHPQFASHDLLLLMDGDGGGTFYSNNVTDISGITAGGPTRCHGIAMGDYDQDGDIDIYTNNGGPHGAPDTIQENFLWRNEGTGANWVSVKLQGVISNRTGVGARLGAETSTGRTVYRTLRVGTGFANTNSHLQHFGIGTDAAVDQIVIDWPSGANQTIRHPALGMVHAVLERQDGDVDGDWSVDVEDLIGVLVAWGPCECDADLTGDGTVGVSDLLDVLLNWAK